MRTKTIYFLIIVVFLITACGGGDGNNVVNDVFVGSRDFVFDTAIDPTTLTQEPSFRLYSYVPSFAPMPESYAIESNEDLVVFNQTHTSDPDEYVSLNDLDTYTYFFIRDPGCPDYFDYSDHSYSNNVLTITLDHFHEPNVECPAVIGQLYLVFKAKKGTVNDSGPDLLISSETRDLSPNNTGDELDLFVRHNNTFAFDLYHAMSGEDENMLFSPYSISVAMAMAWAGARNQTETQMADTLQFNFPQEKLHSLFNELDLDLNNRNENDPENSDKYLKLNIVNEVWGQEDYPFLETYLDTLMLNYGAGIRLVDFMYNPEQARLDINDWVAEETENRIGDLLNQGDVTIYTRLVLTNVIYFNASWGIPFNPDDTYDGIFHLEDGTSVTVRMMIPKAGSGENGETYAATQGPGYQAVELPYYGGDFSMVVIVPDSGVFGAFEQDLDSSVIDEIIGNLEVQEVDLRMPKFEYESRIDLAGTLSAMGMPDAFIPYVADFSGMDGTLDLFIKKIIHQASITLDEAGTEAAAATAVIMSLTSITDPLEISIDRPFIYMIRDNLTGTILFLGRIKNP
jgi:serpin B